jgi:hypothetical protein
MVNLSVFEPEPLPGSSRVSPISSGRLRDLSYPSGSTPNHGSPTSPAGFNTTAGDTITGRDPWNRGNTSDPFLIP